MHRNTDEYHIFITKSFLFSEEATKASEGHRVEVDRGSRTFDFLLVLFEGSLLGSHIAFSESDQTTRGLIDTAHAIVPGGILACCIAVLA